MFLLHRSGLVNLRCNIKTLYCRMASDICIDFKGKCILHLLNRLK